MKKLSQNPIAWLALPFLVLSLFVLLSWPAWRAISPAQARALPSTASVSSTLVDWGELVDFFPMPGGGIVSVTYQVSAGVHAFSFAYSLEGEGILTGRAIMPVQAPPDRAIVRICGRWLHLAANWTEGWSLETAPVYVYRWELPEDSGACEAYSLNFPVVRK